MSGEGLEDCCHSIFRLFPNENPSFQGTATSDKRSPEEGQQHPTFALQFLMPVQEIQPRYPTDADPSTPVG